MTTLHVENTVRDYDSWKAAFDKFDRFRQDQKVRAYRVSRSVEEPNQLAIDLDFDSVEDATAFRAGLVKIWKTPQSKEQLVSHATPQLLDVVEHRSFEPS